jgi:two-component system, cell cycle sensor histidine kinase and response regulator CckA
MKILVVADNPVDRVAIDQSLRSVGSFSCEFPHCSSLGQAMIHAANSVFDAMLLARFLPDSEGIETCVRAVRRIPRLPITVMTGANDEQMLTEVLNAGAHDFLIKGNCSGEVFGRVLRHAIDRHASRCQFVKRDENRFQILSHIPAVVWTTDWRPQIHELSGSGFAAS